MIFTVQWRPTAEDHLMELWMAATDRDAVSSAANAIDRLLGHNPQLQGEVLFDTVRVLSVPPLAVEFEVIDEDCLVHVLTVFRVD